MTPPKGLISKVFGGRWAAEYLGTSDGKATLWKPRKGGPHCEDRGFHERVCLEIGCETP